MWLNRYLKDDWIDTGWDWICVSWMNIYIRSNWMHINMRLIIYICKSTEYM